MQESAPLLTVTTQEGVSVVEFTEADILDEIVISRLSEQLGALAARQDKPRLLLDFGRVRHMSSAALGMLITLHKRVRERNGQLRMCRIQPAIYEVFVITRLNEIFQIHDDREAALASFR